MNIGFVGVGKLGKPCALAMSMKGHNVMCYDMDESLMQKETFPHREIGPNGESSIEGLLQKSDLKFGSLKDTIYHGEIIFVAVQTPHDPRYEGITRLPAERIDFDYTYLINSMKQISSIVDEINEDKIVVVISTVLPGTMRQHILPILSKRIKICYNPYFIAMGTTIPDFINPEFVLFGVVDENAAKKAEEFYKTIHDKPFYKCSLESAEMIKVSYNTWISTKIVLVNNIMEICHKIPGADVDEVTDALKMATDRLVSTKYMTAGMGDGGGCHPRDNIALSWLSRKLNLGHDIFEDIMIAREKQTEFLAKIIAEQYYNEQLPVIILGKSFKEQTNLTIGSPAILLSNILSEFGIKHISFDPWVDTDKNKNDVLSSASIYFIGTRHEDFKDYRFPDGSIVIDPWRIINDQKNVKVIRVGSSK